MTLCLHGNRNRWQINPFTNDDARFIQHSKLIALIMDRVGEFDNRVRNPFSCLVNVEAGVFGNGISPINRAVQFKELVVGVPHIVIYRVETEIIEMQRKSSLDQRVVIESNKNYGVLV